MTSQTTAGLPQRIELQSPESYWPFPAVFEKAALLLDVDGTLLDIAATPGEVHVPAALCASLRRLYKRLGGAVALISGRTVETLDRLFAPLHLPSIGCHGAEMRLKADEAIVERAPPFSESLRARLHRLAKTIPGVALEDKGHAVAVHYRVVPESGKRVLEAVQSCLPEPAGEWELLHGKCVIEVKQAGFDKGTALRALMDHTPFQGRFPLFIGDDVTDEHAFAVLGDFCGIGVSVSRPMEGANYIFADPGAVRKWLAGIAAR